MLMNKNIKILFLCVPLVLASCASKKNLVKETPASTKTAVESQKTTSLISQKLAFVQKVSDTRVYADNIVADISFNLKTEGRNVTVPGSLHMRKDKVIRLQLFIPILGTEVGRLEFTPNEVLVVDRIHKEYFQADYTKLDFLKENGLNFYSLQALFWNQLFLPGKQRVSESDLSKYSVNLDGTGNNVPVSLNNGNMKFTWDADRNTGLINKAVVNYSITAQGQSSLVWNYGDFKNVGVKLFPATQSFTFTTTATAKKQSATVNLELDDITTKSNWDEKTVVSGKYKKVETNDVLGKLMKM